MAHTTANSALLIRSELWANELKKILEEELMAQKYVTWMTDFPDGDTFTIPSIGQSSVDDYVEDTAIAFSALDTGEFQFTITEYLSSAHYITEKARQDAFYAAQLEAMFVPSQHRAIMERLEADILNLSTGQTASAANAINNADHRWVASGTSEVMSIGDFTKAKYSLDKANVPVPGRVAIVDPSVEYELNNNPSLLNLGSVNPRWENIVEEGLNTTGLTFSKNLFGFDVWVSNFLADANETIGAKTTAAGKANMFFNPSVEGGVFKGAWRQMPRVDSEFNIAFQREQYATTARYGLKLYRPEALVCILSDTDQVTF